MICLFISQASMGLSERLYESLVLAVVGMLVVFCALSATALTIVLLNCFFDSISTRQTTRVESDGIEDVPLKVVIAAAATMALGRKVSITRIRAAKSLGRG